MSSAAVEEAVRRKRKEYEKACKGRKGEILDLLVETTGYHRKSLLRALARPRKPTKRPAAVRGRPPRYGRALPALTTLWAALFFACGKRLQPFLPELLRLLVAAGEMKVTPQEQALLLSMSAATIDRLLARDRKGLQGRGRTTTKPGTLLRTSIPIRTFAEWDEQQPGFLEVDLVAHCGGSMAGEFLYTLTMTDVYSGWTVLAPMKGRGQAGAHRAIESGRQGLPFPLQGLDSDNDSIFINEHMRRYCEQHQVTFTRCRPYKKNDQCHVEQKNWTVVRQFVGYCRLETDEQLTLLQQAEALISRYHNLYWPMMRLVKKERNGSRVKKHYDEPRTPYQRLLAVEGLVSDETRQQLQRQYEDPANNPVRLLKRINRLLDQLRDSTRPPTEEPSE